MWKKWLIGLCNSPRWVENGQASFAAQALFLFFGACVGSLVFAFGAGWDKIDWSVALLPLIAYVFLVLPALVYLWGLGLASFYSRSLILRHLAGLLLIELLFLLFWVGMYLFGEVRDFSAQFVKLRTNPLLYSLINLPMLVLAVCMAGLEWLVKKYQRLPDADHSPAGDTDLLDDFIINQNRQNEDDFSL